MAFLRSEEPVDRFQEPSLADEERDRTFAREERDDLQRQVDDLQAKIAAEIAARRFVDASLLADALSSRLMELDYADERVED